MQSVIGYDICLIESALFCKFSYFKYSSAKFRQLLDSIWSQLVFCLPNRKNYTLTVQLNFPLNISFLKMVILQSFCFYLFLYLYLFNCLQELLETGENINQQTMFGTPLSVAVRNNSIDIVKILVSDSKCDVNCRYAFIRCSFKYLISAHFTCCWFENSIFFIILYIE